MSLTPQKKLIPKHNTANKIYFLHNNYYTTKDKANISIKKFNKKKK